MTLLTGKQWDEDIELYYFNARWYDPETARFITEDPIRDGLLWYTYCNNNPMIYIDPTGLDYNGMPSGVQSMLEDNGFLDPDNEGPRTNGGFKPSIEIMEEKVRDFYGYKGKYDLTNDEISDYYGLMNKRLELDDNLAILNDLDDQWAQSEKNRAIREYYKYYMDILVKQTNPALEPGGNMACNYMSVLASIQLITDKPMPISMINRLTMELSVKDNGRGSTVLSGMDAIPANYSTEMWWDVADAALEIVGFGNYDAKFAPGDGLGHFSQAKGPTTNYPKGHWVAFGVTVNKYNYSMSWDPWHYPQMGISHTADKSTIRAPL